MQLKWCNVAAAYRRVQVFICALCVSLVACKQCPLQVASVFWTSQIHLPSELEDNERSCNYRSICEYMWVYVIVWYERVFICQTACWKRGLTGISLSRRWCWLVLRSMMQWKERICQLHELNIQRYASIHYSKSLLSSFSTAATVKVPPFFKSSSFNTCSN